MLIWTDNVLHVRFYLSNQVICIKNMEECLYYAKWIRKMRIGITKDFISKAILAVMSIILSHLISSGDIFIPRDMIERLRMDYLPFVSIYIG